MNPTRHEIAESHELASHSFGKEEELPGRYSVAFKKDVAPSPDEISVIASVDSSPSHGLCTFSIRTWCSQPHAYPAPCGSKWERGQLR